jgi:hypothetical protein
MSSALYELPYIKVKPIFTTKEISVNINETVNLINQECTSITKSWIICNILFDKEYQNSGSEMPNWDFVGDYSFGKLYSNTMKIANDYRILPKDALPDIVEKTCAMYWFQMAKSKSLNKDNDDVILAWPHLKEKILNFRFRGVFVNMFQGPYTVHLHREVTTPLRYMQPIEVSEINSPFSFGGKEVKLNAGESIIFNSSYPHGINFTSNETRIDIIADCQEPTIHDIVNSQKWQIINE